MCSCQFFQRQLPGDLIIPCLGGGGGQPADTMGAARSVSLFSSFGQKRSCQLFLDEQRCCLPASREDPGTAAPSFLSPLLALPCVLGPPLILISTHVQASAGVGSCGTAGTVVFPRCHIRVLFVSIFIEIIIDSCALTRNCAKRSHVRFTQLIPVLPFCKTRVCDHQHTDIGTIY